MEIISLIFLLLIVLWYSIALLLIFYLYYNNCRPYETKFQEPYLKEFPSIRTPGELSLLMFHKIEPQVYTTAILGLIKKGVLELKYRDNEYYFKVTDKNIEMTHSEKVIEDFLLLVGIDREFTLTRFKNYCGTKRGDSEFLFQFDLWKKVMRKESSGTHFFEDKKGYQMVKMIRNIGLFLWIGNMLVSHFIIGYFMILPIFLIPLFFSKIYKRTEEFNEEYHKWLAFKTYLERSQEFKIDDIHQYTSSAIVLGKMDCLKQYCPNDKSITFAHLLNETIINCHKHAYLHGNRRIYGISNRR